jgi:BirA family biotin operon repressor/biotin-[acetyl-CoA-carboxylase] ligase
VLAEVDSTNAEGMRLAPTLTQPTWILGLRQTGGRGRRGRPWADPSGNFAATLVMRPTESADHAALRSFVAALALTDALTLATGRPELFRIKWPNDVLLQGAKLSGILLESTGQGGQIDTLCIGIGVNLLGAPEASGLEPGAVAPTSLLSGAGVRISPEDFLDLLAPAYAERETQFTAGGFPALREAWLSQAARLGEVITARTARESHNGTFETIDDRGALVLRTAKGRLAIPAADIFF